MKKMSIIFFSISILITSSMAVESEGSNANEKFSFIKEIYSEFGVQVMNDEMEKVIRSSPCEYSWEYKKFRRLPSGVKDIYKN